MAPLIISSPCRAHLVLPAALCVSMCLIPHKILMQNNWHLNGWDHVVSHQSLSIHHIILYYPPDRPALYSQLELWWSTWLRLKVSVMKWSQQAMAAAGGWCSCFSLWLLLLLTVWRSTREWMHFLWFPAINAAADVSICLPAGLVTDNPPYGPATGGGGGCQRWPPLLYTPTPYICVRRWFTVVSMLAHLLWILGRHWMDFRWVWMHVASHPVPTPPIIHPPPDPLCLPV